LAADLTITLWSEGNLATAELGITLKEHPIMLTLQDSISGNGFLARITMSGRALMREEEAGEWWIYGVRPAALAASGENIDQAFQRFRDAYWQVLADMAAESFSFEAFEAEVQRFFAEKDADNEDETLWEAALAAIRGGVCEPPAPFAKLPRRSPEQYPSFIKVERTDAQALDVRLTPSDNVPPAVFAYTLPKAA
jgi:hypothetical protein